MRIGIDARESGTSTGRYVDGLLEQLSKMKTPHEFVVIAKPERLEFIKSIAPNLEIVTSKYKEFTFGEQYGYVWQLYGLRLDLMHFCMIQQPILYFGKTISTMMDLTTARYVNPSKNWPVFKFKQLVYRFVIKVVARKSKHIITISDWVKYDLAHFTGVSPAKITTTYPAFGHTDGPSEPYAPMKGKRFLLYMGRPLPHKNLKRLVEAFAILKTKYKDLHLVCAGKSDANYQLIEDYVKDRKIQDVVFTGWMDDVQGKWLYENAAAYVVASLSEGFGMPGLEAMSYGAVVASSFATCSPEVYRDGALYFDPYDVDDMAAKIGQLLDDKDLAKSLAAKGQKVAKSYSWERMVRQTLPIYEAVSQHRGDYPQPGKTGS